MTLPGLNSVPFSEELQTMKIGFLTRNRKRRQVLPGQPCTMNSVCVETVEPFGQQHPWNEGPSLPQGRVPVQNFEIDRDQSGFHDAGPTQLQDEIVPVRTEFDFKVPVWTCQKDLDDLEFPQRVCRPCRDIGRRIIMKRRGHIDPDSVLSLVDSNDSDLGFRNRMTIPGVVDTIDDAACLQGRDDTIGVSPTAAVPRPDRGRRPARPYPKSPRKGDARPGR